MITKLLLANWPAALYALLFLGSACLMALGTVLATLWWDDWRDRRWIRESRRLRKSDL